MKKELCEQIVLRVPASLRDAVARVAAADDRSLAYAARKLLERAVRQEDDHAV
jgi:hypothetical protein